MGGVGERRKRLPRLLFRTVANLNKKFRSEETNTAIKLPIIIVGNAKLGNVISFPSK